MLLKFMQVLIMLKIYLIWTATWRYWIFNKKYLIDLLSELKDFKFVTALALEFKKIETDDKTKYDTLYSNSKAETIINENDIDDVFESIYTTVMTKTQKSRGKVFLLIRWITDSVMGHNINISIYNPATDSSKTKLPKELE